MVVTCLELQIKLANVACVTLDGLSRLPEKLTMMSNGLLRASRRFPLGSLPRRMHVARTAARGGIRPFILCLIRRKMPPILKCGRQRTLGLSVMPQGIFREEKGGDSESG